MTAEPLGGKQRRHLRALAHHLSPLVQIGKDGLGAGLVAAVKQALLDHELIKIKVLSGAPLDRHEAAEWLVEQTGAALVQVLGNNVLIYQAHPTEPKLALPGAARPPRAPPPKKPRRSK
jgi:RNA-binding protein